MKKILLALAVLASAGAANAATVYDRDGTQLAIGGRVQAVVYNGKYKKLENNDSTLVNSGRLNISGTAKVNDIFSVFAFTEWNMADGNKAGNGESINTRDQYIGADFNRYGKILVGKTYDAVYSVQAVTDLFEDVAVTAQAETCADRRTGTIKYTYDNYGFFAQAAGLTAGDSVRVMGSDKFADTGLNNNVKGGFSGALGYTFDDVIFGPLSIKAGYSYIKGAEQGDMGLKAFDTFKNTAASVSWGNDSEGLYLAALYTQTVTKYDKYDKDVKLYFGEGRTMKGLELVCGYSFTNGISVLTGFEIGNENYKSQQKKYITKRIPVYVNYRLNSNFKVWAEAEFDAGSTKESKDNENKATDTLLSLGARYTF